MNNAVTLDTRDAKLSDLASKGDLMAAQGEITLELVAVRAELLVIKWMLGLVLLVTVIPVLKDIFLK